MPVPDVTDRDADEREVRAVVARADAGQVEPTALIPLHAPDAVVVNIAGRRVLGRDAFAAAMAAALESPLRDVRTSVEVVDVRFPGSDVAVASCVKTVHDERADADAAPLTGALTYVLVRTPPAAWHIALAQTTPTAT